MNRSHTHLFRRTLISIAGALAFSAIPVTSPALDYYIDTGVDTASNASSGSPSCGSPCSLRAAILAANANPGADTIHLGEFNLSLFINGSDEDSAVTGDLDITGDLTIIGEQSVSRNPIDASGLGDRVFHVIGNTEVVMRNIAIIGGSVTNMGGGGIYVSHNGYIELDNVELRSNTVVADLASFETVGGGIYINVPARAKITNSLFYKNKAPAGGALSNSGRAEVRGSVFDDNEAYKNLNGGAINNAGGYLVLGNSTVKNNRATQSGGGMYNSNLGENFGAVVITNTEFFNNTAAAQGGAIANFSPLSINNSSINNNLSTFDGGGIYNSGIGNIDMINSTVSENSGRSGGGIFNTRVINLTNTTIYNNFSAPCTVACDGGTSNNGLIGGNQVAIFTAGGASNPELTLANTIIANGPASNPNEPPCSGDTGYTANISTVGNNMENDETCGLISSHPLNDLTNVLSAELLDLEIDPNYPNTTSVHPLDGDSEAIDQGSNSNCPAVDQRFLVRDDLCDIGAYEFGASQQQVGGLVDLRVTIADSPDPVAPNSDNQPLTYAIAVTNLYVDDAADDVVVEFSLPASFWFDRITATSTGATPECGQPDASNVITCTVSSIAGLGQVEFFISGTPTVVGTITLTVDAFSTTIDAFPQNNRDVKEETVVNNEADDTDNHGTPSRRRGGGSSDLLFLALAGLPLIARRYFSAKR